MREGKLPLRIVLQNFINHVDTLEAKRSEGNDQYEVEFQELKQLTESLKGRTEFSCTEGEKDVNRRKNRYKDILPYDYTRVVLSGYPGVPGSDYINANFIRGASGSRAYIGSQGPLPHTVPDFWRMVVECEVQVIVMASNETEGGKHKCECYWVNSQCEERQFGNVTVSFVKARQVCPDFMVRTLKIKYTNDAGNTEERTICQFHYVLWPDHGVPETVRPLLDMVRLVRDCQASETLPVLVHCSAGCGRTGTICAIDYVWGLLRAGRLTENLNLFGLVKEMRRQRVAMVQTREQYILLHRAVRELFKERLKVIDAHPYENIATDGTPLILREKESDYEELYVRPEKQDESAKPTPPTTTPSVASTPTGSLTRYAHTQDFLLPPSPAGTLDRPVATVLPLQMKYTKTQQASPSSGTLTPLTQSSPGPHASPLPQPSPLSPSSPLPAASPVPLPSPSQAQISFVGPPAPRPLGSSSRSVPQPSLAPESLRLALSSKLEKEAENAAHKRQAGLQLLPTASTPQENTASTPSGPPAPPRSPSLAKNRPSLPRATSNRLCESEQGAEMGQRPSIAKLKELFERSGQAEGPPMARLSRSASSVTARPAALSVHTAADGSHRIKRKSSLGAEETLATKKAFEALERCRQLEGGGGSVGGGSGGGQAGSDTTTTTTATTTTITATQPFSSPTRHQTEGRLNPVEDGSTSALLARVDERPALPVKKSKSFRYVRPGAAAGRAAASPRSPELARKKADINTYFSLDRCRLDSAAHNRCEGGGSGVGGGVSFLGDIPSPREGFKLSVYQMPRLVGLPKSDARPQIPPKRVIGEKFRTNKPLQFPLITSPQLPSSSSSLSPSSSTPSSTSSSSSSSSFSSSSFPHTHIIPCSSVYAQLPLSSLLPFSTLSSQPITTSSLPSQPVYYSHPTVSMMPATTTITTTTTTTTMSTTAIASNTTTTPTSTSTSTTTTSITTTLTSITTATTTTTTTSSSTLASSSLIYDCPRDLQVGSKTPQHGPFGLARLPGGCPSPQPPSDSPDTAAVTAKDYVNARLVRQPQRCIYVPLPARRATLEGRPAREYANCSLGGQSPAVEDDPASRATGSAKFPVYDEVSPIRAESTCTLSREAASHPSPDSATCGPGSGVASSSPGSGDYEMMDFGESSASVDEVFETVNYQLLAAATAAGSSGQQQQQAGSCGAGEDRGRRDLDPVARQVFQACRDYLLQGDSTADVQEVASRVAVAPQGLRTRERRNSYRQAVSRATSARLPNGRPHPAQPRTGHKYETIWFENARHLSQCGGGQSPATLGQEQEEPVVSAAEDLRANLDQHGGVGGKEALFREKLEELHSLVAGLGRAGWPEEDDPSRGSASGSGSLGSSSSSLRCVPEAMAASTIISQQQQQQQLSSPQPSKRSDPEAISPSGPPLLRPGWPDASLLNGSTPYSTTTTTSLRGKPSTPYRCPSTALPGCCSPYHNIPPPKGFGSGSSPRHSPGSPPETSTAPHYTSAIPRNPAAIAGKASTAVPLYTNLPAIVRNRFPHPHPYPSKALIVGDVAYVGEECVRLRRSGANAVAPRGDAGEGPDTPVAPPRVKRNSSVGPPRYRVSEHMSNAFLQEWRLSGPRDTTQQAVVTGKQVRPTREEEAPPVVPAKTAAAYEFLDHPEPPQPPPHHHHHHHPHPNPQSHSHLHTPHYTHLPPPKPLPPKHRSQPAPPQRQPSSPQLSDGELGGRGEEALGGDSSSESSDEEGIFHKFSAPNIFRKWRSGGGSSNSGGGGGSGSRQVAMAPASPKSTFYAGRVEPAEAAAPPTLTSPTSPKPLAKALGKLKLNSRSVAANFKSYLSQRSGGQVEAGEAGGEAGGKMNGHSSESASPPTSWRAIQKSVSSGATLSAFTQAAQDYKYPNAIPKKPAGPRDMPAILRGPALTVSATASAADSSIKVKMDRPRQQYL